MKKFIAINGSPRRNGNTAQLLDEAIRGAADAGAETKLVNLYALNFKGCTSCFYCKLKSKPHGTCAMKDDLSPILEELKTADGVVFGVPIYFMNFSADMVAFLERFYFSNYIYSAEIPTVFPKKLPSAFFLTMNMTEKHFAQFGMAAKLAPYEMVTKNILQVAPKMLCAFNTVQFKDYSKYESSIFDPEDKFAYREKTFAQTCAEAYEIGRALIAES